MLAIIQRFGIVCGAIGQWAFVLLFLFSLVNVMLGTMPWGDALAITLFGVGMMIAGMIARYVLAGSTH
jgi:hypothetical protein